ncbi:hypothetical protein PMAYCL1PPCAC_29898, partial [Pristionchus mayeri]
PLRMSRFPSSYGAASMLQLLLLLLITVFILTMISISVVNQTEIYTLQQRRMHSKRSLPRTPPHRLLIGYLSSVDYKTGLANHVFELISLVGLARAVGRKAGLPASYFDHIREEHRDLPHLLEAFERCGEEEMETPRLRLDLHSCCRYHSSIVEELSRRDDEERVNAQVFHLQSFKYFSSILPREQILALLELSHKLKHKATRHLLDRDELMSYDHRVCVHSRRGDFLSSPLHAPSNELFVLPAIEFMIDHVRSHLNSSSPLVVMIGDDEKWERDIISSFYRTPSLILPSNSSLPPVTAWHFARIYCDSVLLTASSSTFGWWLAYQSKGQHIFFNSVFSKPGGFGRSLNSDDYFPHDWNELEFDPSTSRVGIRERFF